jgi:hypothetical protein
MALGGTVAILENLWQSFLGYLPGLVGGIVLLIIGWAVGRVIGRVIKEILVKAEVDQYIKEEGHLNFEISSVIDVIVRWFIYLAFISAASQVLGAPGVATFVENILYTILPGIVGAGIVLLVAYVIGIYFKEGLTQHKEGEETIYADLSGKLVFWISMFFGVALALDIFFRSVLSTPSSLLPNILMIIVGAVGLGVAIAIGLGLKDVVGEMAEDYAKDFKKKRK